jgi:FixJ family two-component response regulator
MSGDPTIFIVDDDEPLRDAICLLLESVGYQVSAYANGEAFLQDYYPGCAGCLVLDIRMPGMSGIELQEQMWRQGVQLPIIFISGHGDIPMAVRAMKAGAIDFLEKPFNDEDLLRSIRNALNTDSELRRIQSEKSRIATSLASLTSEERSILEMLCDGRSNKEMAQSMEMGIKILEAHRSNVMEKMGARSLAELVKLAVLGGVTSHTWSEDR